LQLPPSKLQRTLQLRSERCNFNFFRQWYLLNIEQFCSGKKPADQVFDKVSARALNQYLQKFMPGLTAKVFRTFHASHTLENALSAVPDRIQAEEAVQRFKSANSLCAEQLGRFAPYTRR